MSYDREPVEATIEQLEPRMKSLEITFKVLEKGDVREVTSRKTGETNRVCDAVVGDSTGTVVVPLWNETIENVESGTTYTLKNGYTGLFRGNLRLNIGRYGEIGPAEAPIEEINNEKDMSAAEHERQRREYGRGGFGPSYGGARPGGYGGGGRDRSYGSRDRRRDDGYRRRRY